MVSSVSGVTGGPGWGQAKSAAAKADKDEKKAAKEAEKDARDAAKGKTSDTPAPPAPTPTPVPVAPPMASPPPATPPVSAPVATPPVSTPVATPPAAPAPATPVKQVPPAPPPVATSPVEQAPSVEEPSVPVAKPRKDDEPVAPDAGPSAQTVAETPVAARPTAARAPGRSLRDYYRDAMGRSDAMAGVVQAFSRLSGGAWAPSRELLQIQEVQAAEAARQTARELVAESAYVAAAKSGNRYGNVTRLLDA